MLLSSFEIVIAGVQGMYQSLDKLLNLKASRAKNYTCQAANGTEVFGISGAERITGLHAVAAIRASAS